MVNGWHRVALGRLLRRCAARNDVASVASRLAMTGLEIEFVLQAFEAVAADFQGNPIF